MSDVAKLSEYYFNFAILAWDWPTRKVEDNPQDVIYFENEKHKKEVCKGLNELRKTSVISYYENKETSTSYNVYKRSNGEVIVAFRGSDSKADWIADFLFFKTKYEENNKDLKVSMSNEDFDNLLMNEYKKSIENTDLARVVSIFRNTSLTGISDLVDINFEDTNNDIITVFNKFKQNLKFHGGFMGQYKSVSSELDILFNELIVDTSVKKISIVGHSLGSSLAHLCHIIQHIRHPTCKKMTTYIYGTPRLGGTLFYKFLIESKLINNICISNIEGDICSLIPPTNFGFLPHINTVTIKPLKAPFNTKLNHTLWYYLYCYKHKAPLIINKKYFK